MAKRFVLTYPETLFACFFCGVAAGTIIANCLSGELLGQLGYFDGANVRDGAPAAQFFYSGGAGKELQAAGLGSVSGGGNAASGFRRVLLWIKGWFGSEQHRRLWGCAAGQRFTEYGAAVLLGMTPFAAAGFAALSFAGGFGCGLTLAVMTLERGAWGLGAYVQMMLPQWLCYFPVWAVLALNAGSGLGRMRRRVWPVLFLAAAAGTFLESYVNPFLLML